MFTTAVAAGIAMPSVVNRLKTRIRSFVRNNLVTGVAALGDDDSFLDKGIIDSAGVLTLVSFLERSFGVKVKDEELLPENLDSINRLVGFLGRKGVQQ